MEFLIAALALLLGGLAGWILAQRRASLASDALRDDLANTQTQLARIEAQAAERERGFEEQKRLLLDAGQKVQDAFARLSQEALARNSKTLLDQTQERLTPLKEQLAKLEAQTTSLGKTTAQTYGSLEKHIEELSKSTTTLTRTNDGLVSALKGSMTARGRFGEVQLRNLVDASGMLQHCDFLEQEQIEGGQRPDMLIKLPEGDMIPVDAKMPLSAYWAAVDATDPETRTAKLHEHAKLLRRQVSDLAKRNYPEFVKGRLDFTVLFLPADPIWAAAYEVAPEVLDEAARQRVFIVTPSTFLLLLTTSRILWNQRAIAEGAHKIQEAANEFYKRVLVYQSHVMKIGSALDRASQSFHDAMSSYHSRILPSGRRLEALGGTNESREILPEVEIVPPHPIAARFPAEPVADGREPTEVS